MKGKRINIFCMAMAAAMLLAGCENAQENAAAPSEETTIADNSADESATETAADSVAESVTESAAKKTGKSKKQPTPLTAGKNKAYYEDEDFSVTAELTDLCSSLYYPDVVHDMGINPELFTVTVLVKARNMSEEEKTFDVSKFSISDLFFFGGDTEKFENIKPAKTVSGELHFLCSLEQAAEIDGIIYGNEYLETGEEFYPEEFDDIIEIQSADDVRDYLYRKFYTHIMNGYFFHDNTPTTCEMHHIKGIKNGEENYISVSFSACNRSDYAQLIKPSDFRIKCSRNASKETTEADCKILEPLYISVDEDLVYDPQKAEIKLKGTGQLYKLPEFISMKRENPTEFTLIYPAEDFFRVRMLVFFLLHEDEPYFMDFNREIHVFDWDIWEEKTYEP